MILACQKLLGQITKVLFWIEETSPTPCWEKLPNNPVFFLKGSLTNDIRLLVKMPLGPKFTISQYNLLWSLFGNGHVRQKKTLKWIKHQWCQKWDWVRWMVWVYPGGVRFWAPHGAKKISVNADVSSRALLVLSSWEKEQLQLVKDHKLDKKTDLRISLF